MSQSNDFIIDLVWYSGIRHANNIALIDADLKSISGENQITYEQLFQRVNILSEAIRKVFLSKQNKKVNFTTQIDL